MVNRARGSRRKRGILRQRLLPPFEWAARRERCFKAGIVAVTVLAVLGLCLATPLGRSGTTAGLRRLKWTAQGVLGVAPDRAEIDTHWSALRLRGIEHTRQTYRAFFEHDASAGLRAILSAAGMGPEQVLLRWANIDWTIVLSPLVFAPDDCGRSYRMRPRLRSYWLVDHTLTRGLTSFFFLPDLPEVNAAVARAGAVIMPESYQTTNSWGCRGPEPDPKAPVRILVLGDSFMQGLFVPDDQTPPEHLRRFLEKRWGEPVSVLNTGHIGYSPEQYYHTLGEYFDPFQPQLVVVNVCINDFGDPFNLLRGKVDWSEPRYWLEAIEGFCRSRLTPCLLVAAPVELQILGHRDASAYPAGVINLWGENCIDFLDLTDPFVSEHLRLMGESIRSGVRPVNSPLFNGHISDAHFSPRGAALWGRVVGERLALITEYHRAKYRRGMPP